MVMGKQREIYLLMQKLLYLKNSIWLNLFSFLLLHFVLTTPLHAQQNCSFQLENPDFESPDILTNFGASGNSFVLEKDLSGWKTTAPDDYFEIWRSGFMGVPAYSGKQFIEINANSVAAVYNDATTVPSSTISFGFAHRGREGVDKIELKIGPPGGPYISKGVYSTGKNAWKYYTTSYTVPVGQTTTRFIFEAVSSAGGIAVGNFLDDINVIDVNIDMDIKGSSVCGESTGKIEITGAKPEGVSLEYSIDNVNFQTSNVFNNLPLGNYIVYLKANGICIRNKSVTIPPSTGLTVNLGTPKNVCSGNSVALDAKIPGCTYLWSTGETSQSITVNSSNIYSVLVTDAKGCKGTASVSVKVNPNPLVILGADQQICDGESLEIDAGNTGSTYFWNTGATSKSITVKTSNTYSVKVSDANGCIGNDTIVVKVNQKPFVTLGPDQLFCPGESIILDAGNAGITYLWNTGATSQKITVNTAGTYSVSITDANACKANSSVKLSPKIILNLGKDTIICKGNTVLLDAKNTGSNFLWSTGENTQSILVKSAGTYEVAVSDGLTCTVKDQIIVSLDSLINPYENFDTTFCQGQSLLLQYSDATYNITWLNYPSEKEIKIYTSGNYSAILSNKYCKDTFEIRVNIMDTLAAQIIQQGNKSYYCFKEDTALLRIVVNDSVNYSVFWNHNFSRENEIIVDKAGVYSAIIDNGHCVSNISSEVIEYCTPTFYLPNAFTPNYDGLNDVFPPYQTGIFNDYAMEIYNRWGELIFKSKDINVGWDGKMGNKEVQMDVYVYKIYYSYFNENEIELQKTFTGTLTLLK